jgi:DNA-binding transcriptional MerR regulator
VLYSYLSSTQKSTIVLEGRRLRLKKFLRTSDLATAAHLSVQAIRNYEKWGILPPAERSAKGYRLYTPKHLDALRIAQALATGYSWRNAARIMQSLHNGDLAVALAIIDAQHAEIHRNRCEVEQTLHVLRTMPPAQLPKPARNMPVHKSDLYVNEVAKLVGVRVSAVRYWEERGLLQPKRATNNTYRVYDAEQFRKLQFIVLLRKANYDIKAIQHILGQLGTGSPEQALLAAEKRLKDLTEASYQCMQATTELWTYIAEGTE